MPRLSKPAPTRVDAIVLGAGAAGLMCAATAGLRGRRVVLIDHAPKAGKKILISGGGRCNFTNIHAEPANFLSENPHFAKSALSRYRPQDFIDLVDRYGIAWHEKTLGQLFCDGSARQIVDLLLDQCRQGGVDLRLGQSIQDVGHADGLFHVTLNDQHFEAKSLVLATGGPSIPKMGATGFAYEIAKQFDLTVMPPRPALVPFTLDPDQSRFTALAGVATETIASVGAAAFREAFLFTHRGLSGPAVLQISSYWRPGQSIELNLVPQRTAGWLAQEKRNRPKSNLQAVLSDILPARLAQTLAPIVTGDSPHAAQLSNMSDKVLSAIETRLARWPFRPSGTEGYAKAEVTAGGISTAELSSRTMEAKRVPGLYCIGECVDVTGWLGGYNFQWAWASGVVAGETL